MYTCTLVYILTCVCMPCVCIHIHVHVNTCIYMCVCVRAFVKTYYTRNRVRTRASICTSMCSIRICMQYCRGHCHNVITEPIPWGFLLLSVCRLHKARGRGAPRCVRVYLQKSWCMRMSKPSQSVVSVPGAQEPLDPVKLAWSMSSQTSSSASRQESGPGAVATPDSDMSVH